MNGRKKRACLCTLFVLAFGVFAVQGADAAILGTTAFTCKEKATKGGVGFSRTHCKPADAVGSGAAFEHVWIEQEKTTEVIGSSSATSESTTESVGMRLKFTLAGAAVEFVATGVSGSGWMNNAKALITGEHFVYGEGAVTFTGVTEKLLGCKVKGGSITTKKLKATTSTVGNTLTFEPAEGTLLAKFELEGCIINGTYELKGSVKGTPDGATVNFTHAKTTALTTLTFAGQNAGIEGSVTFSGRSGFAGSYTPLSVTTVET
jgi:hypothetical protein